MTTSTLFGGNTNKINNIITRYFIVANYHIFSLKEYFKHKLTNKLFHNIATNKS